VDGGFAQVREDVVTVLTPRAIKAENIDTAAATRTLESPPVSADEPDARQKAQERARAQLRIAQRTDGRPHGGTH
jgi:F-type H+-transporting ATPase subunit epsilon